jgi:hypothetical protein
LQRAGEKVVTAVTVLGFGLGFLGAHANVTKTVNNLHERMPENTLISEFAPQDTGKPPAGDGSGSRT